MKIVEIMVILRHERRTAGKTTVVYPTRVRQDSKARDCRECAATYSSFRHTVEARVFELAPPTTRYHSY